MTAIDNCQAITTSSFFAINEVTTVASVYALAQFINPSTGNIGSYGYATTGIDNAFALTQTLYDGSSGQAYFTTPGGSGAVPQSEINTLANILVPCVNSSGPSSPGCSSLFPLTGNPSNILLAALHIALNPGSNVHALKDLAAADSPFQPSLSGYPNDFTVAVGYNSGALGATGLAIDAIGNIWIADHRNTGANSRLVKVSPLGVPALGSPFSNNTNDLFAIAIDTIGNVWGARYSVNNITAYSFNGTPGATFLTGTHPQAISIDAGNNIWTANASSSVTEISRFGNQISGNSGYTAGGINNPTSIAFDLSGNAWISNYNTSSLSEYDAYGTALSSSGFTGGGTNQPESVAISSSGSVFVGNFGAPHLSAFTSAGSPISGSGYTGGGVGPTAAIVFDGANNLWSASTANILSEYSGAGAPVSPASGYLSAGLNSPAGIGVDPSGNVWVVGNASNTVNGISVNLINFVGLAAPAITPIAAGLQYSQLDILYGTPVPISITSSALPFYTQNGAYSAQLQANGGNTDTYTWSLVSGSLPAGFTLSSSGVISGTTSGTSTASFTVQAADSGNLANTAQQSLTLSERSQLPTGNDGALLGTFVVQISGFKGGSVSTTGGVSGYAALGRLLFNGTGNVSGSMDYNGADGSQLQFAVTGYYTVGADGRGTITLTGGTAGLLPSQFAFAMNNAGSAMTLQEFDYTGTGATTGLATGVGKSQVGSSLFASAINQNLVFGLKGETPCASCAPGVSGQYGPLSLVGRLSNAANVSTGEEDGGSTGTPYTGVTLAGTYTSPDSAGRGTLTLTPTGAIFPGAPVTYIYYVVGSGEVYLMSSDSHTTSGLLYGDALAQTGTFTNATVNGTYIASELAATQGDGVNQYPPFSKATVVAFTGDGNGNASYIQDVNSAGQVGIESQQSGVPYAVDANGRMTLAGGAGGTPVFYLADGTTGFASEMPQSGDTPGLLTIQKQTATGVSCSSFSGNFFYGNPAIPTAMSTSTGVLNISSGSIGAANDNADSSGALTLNQSNTFTCSTDALTATIGNLNFVDSSGHRSVAFVVSPSETVIVDIRPNHTKPTITVLQAR